MNSLTDGVSCIGPHPATRTEAQARADIAQRRLHLRPVADDEIPTGHPHPCYAVVQRKNGEWTTAATIRSVHNTETAAETEATRLKVIQPDQAFGVFSLRSEAVPTQKPVEIARVES